MKLHITENPTKEEALDIADKYSLDIPASHFETCTAIISNTNEELNRSWVTYAGEIKGKTDTNKWSLTFEVDQI